MCMCATRMLRLYPWVWRQHRYSQVLIGAKGTQGTCLCDGVVMAIGGRYARELRVPFIPYIGEVAELMTALLRYKYHMEIRTAAVECMPEVCMPSHLQAPPGLRTSRHDWGRPSNIGTWMRGLAR